MKKLSEILSDADLPYGLFSIAALENLLQECIQCEQYENAAKIRDIIKKRKDKIEYIKNLSQNIKNL